MLTITDLKADSLAPKQRAPYTPFDWNKISLDDLGKGELVRSVLTPAQHAVFLKVAHFQDKRLDPGHGEIVTWLACKLAKAAGLSVEDTDVVVHEAMLHDTGWSQIPDITEIYRKQITAMRAGDSDEERAAAKAADAALRVRHQDESVKIARQVIPNHKCLDEICLVIGDHDTRLKIEEYRGIHWLMLDADMLWRVTLPGVMAALQHNMKLRRSDSDKSCLEWLTIERKKCVTELGLYAGRHEAIATLEQLSPLEGNKFDGVIQSLRTILG